MKKKLTDPQEFNFKLGAQQFLMEMCTHLKEKSPLKSVFARCLKCLSPSYMVEYSEACEILFQKLLEKLVSYEKIVPSIADDAKMEYSGFVSVIVKKNSDEFLSFKKEKDRLDVFLWRYIGAKSQFSKLRNVFSMLLILSHGQAQVERGFSTSKLLLDVNMQNETLVAQRIVHNHMFRENMKPQDLQMTKHLMELVKDVRKSYFLHLKEEGLKKLKTDAEEKREKISDDIEDTNC